MEPETQETPRPSLRELRDQAVAHEQGDGLQCTRCGCRLFAVISSTRRPGYILRRRKCRHCGKRVTTTERPVGWESDDDEKARQNDSA